MSVGTDQLADDAVTLAKMADNSVGSNEIINESISSVDIDDGEVGNADLATDAVTLVKMANDSVGSDEIATDAVGSSEIADNSIAAADISPNAVGSSEIASNAVAVSELRYEVVTVTFDIGHSYASSGSIFLQNGQILGYYPVDYREAKPPGKIMLYDDGMVGVFLQDDADYTSSLAVVVLMP